MIYNFSDLSKLSPQAQNDKLEVYNLAIKNTVADFLAHFSGSGTFHLRAEVVTAWSTNHGSTISNEFNRTPTQRLQRYWMAHHRNHGVTSRPGVSRRGGDSFV